MAAPGVGDIRLHARPLWRSASIRHRARPHLLPLLGRQRPGQGDFRSLTNDFEDRQRTHYDEIGEEYEAHYSDEWSKKYRQLFFYEPLIAGVDLAVRKVLDALCGSGQTAGFLMSQRSEA